MLKKLGICDKKTETATTPINTSSSSSPQQEMSRPVALITGCSSGVGLSLAVQMATAGFKVYATMRNLSKADELKVAVETAKVQDGVVIAELDVCTDESVNNAVKNIIEAESRIDVLVNNAGFSMFGGVEMVSIEDMKVQFETNFYGAIRAMRAVLPHMRKQKSGHIINVSSVGGVWGQPLNDVYCGSKFALEGFVESMLPIYKQLGIQCVLIEPGAIKTAFMANVQRPDLTKVDPDLHPFIARIAQVYAESAKSSNAQTPDEVARIILEAAQNPNPPLRVQTNPAIDAIFKAQLSNPTGLNGYGFAMNRFFPEGWRDLLPKQ